MLPVVAVQDRAAFDAVLKLADKALQEFQGLLAITDLQGVVKKLRVLADLFERFPLLDNDISMLRSRLRGMMSSDPDRTPVTGLSAEMAAVRERSRGLTASGGFAAPTTVTQAPIIPLPGKKRDPR